MLKRYLAALFVFGSLQAAIASPYNLFVFDGQAATTPVKTGQVLLVMAPKGEWLAAVQQGGYITLDSATVPFSQFVSGIAQLTVNTNVPDATPDCYSHVAVGHKDAVYMSLASAPSQPCGLT